MKHLKEQIIKTLKEANKETSVDIKQYIDDIDIDEDTTSDDIKDYFFDNNAFDIEIVYYSNAIKFLSENDASLADSLELASEYGYEVENLNSTILASLLASKLEQENFDFCESEVNELIENYFENMEV